MARPGGTKRAQKGKKEGCSGSDGCIWEAAGRRSEDLSQWAEQEKGKAALHMLNQPSKVL